MSKKIEMTYREMQVAYAGLKSLLEENKDGSHRDEIKALMEKLREAHNNE